MRRLLLGLGLVTALAVGAGVVYAAVPGNDGKVHFCFKASDAAKAGGASVTIIDPDLGGSCKSGQVETSVLDQGLVTGAASGPGGFGFTFPSVGGFNAKVTTAKPTKLFIIGTLDVLARCASTDPCALRYMLHVDGEQVQETFRSFPGTVAGKEDNATAFAVVDVGAGEHTVEWRSGIFGEQFNSSTGTWVGAIALGG